jgi:hypothetical protein
MARTGDDDQELDVDALFGEQFRYDPESVDQLRRGTRTRPRKTSLTHGRSFMRLSCAHTGMSGNEVSLYESLEMTKAEREQTQLDSFWGLDKEANDKANEIAQMRQEEVHSVAHEMYCKTEEMKKFWEEEEILSSELQRKEKNIEEENARAEYLRDFYAAAASGDIINYKWPTRSSFVPPLSAVAVDPEEGNQTDRANGYEIWNLVGEPSTIHLDGLQQSRTISLNGETYDPRKTASIADLAMRPVGTRRNKPHQHTHHSSSPHHHHSNSANGIYSVETPSFLASSGPLPLQLAKDWSVPSVHSSSQGVGSVISSSSPAPASKLTQPSSHSHRNKINLLELNNSKYLAGLFLTFLLSPPRSPSPLRQNPTNSFSPNLLPNTAISWMAILSITGILLNSFVLHFVISMCWGRELFVVRISQSLGTIVRSITVSDTLSSG